jgi:hypothetical protein
MPRVEKSGPSPGAGLSKTTVFNRRPISFSVQYYQNLEHPTAAAGNLFRIVISLLYPSAPKPAAKPE